MKRHFNVLEIARCLNIAPSILERWIRQGRIPVKKKGDQCIFNRQALQRWADANHLKLELSIPESDTGKTTESRMDDLLTVMQRGGVFYDVEGNSIEEVLNSAVELIKDLTTDQKKGLYESLLAREKLMSTGIGKGVAIPHPRTPMGFSNFPAMITTCFLKTPVNYQAVDKQPVFILFLLISPTSKDHLHLLSRLSFCVRDENFMKLLNQKPDEDTFFEKIAEIEGRLDPSE